MMEWISVKSQPPPVETRVLVNRIDIDWVDIAEYHEICPDWDDGGMWLGDDDYHFNEKYVSHWMPLPKNIGFAWERLLDSIEYKCANEIKRSELRIAFGLRNQLT